MQLTAKSTCVEMWQLLEMTWALVLPRQSNRGRPCALCQSFIMASCSVSSFECTLLLFLTACSVASYLVMSSSSTGLCHIVLTTEVSLANVLLQLSSITKLFSLLWFSLLRFLHSLMVLLCLVKVYIWLRICAYM